MSLSGDAHANKKKKKHQMEVVHQDNSNVSLRYGAMMSAHYQCASVYKSVGFITVMMNLQLVEPNGC